MHPGLTRMRPAQARALHLLDAEHGALTVDTPTPTSWADRDALELAYRTGARELLDQDARAWLEWVEHKHTLAAYGHAPLTPEPAQPDTLATLHQLLTLAANMMTAEIVEPTPEPDEEDADS